MTREAATKRYNSATNRQALGENRYDMGSGDKALQLGN